MTRTTKTKRRAAAGVLLLALAGTAVAGAYRRGGAAPAVSQPVPAAKPIEPATPRPTPTPAPAPASAPTPAPFVVRRILDTGGPIRYGTWFWDERGAPAAGPMIVTVDLAASTISAFRDGYEIGASAIIRGLEGKDTPLGVFPITEKDADHRSRTYGGAPMPYMLRLTSDGVAIHGSPKITYDAATHGCIGVPVAFAKKLYGVMKRGDRVIITQGRTIGIGDAIAR